MFQSPSRTSFWLALGKSCFPHGPLFHPWTSVFATHPSPPGIQSNAAANPSSLTVSILHHGSNTSAAMICWTATFFLYLNEVFDSPHPYCKHSSTAGFLNISFYLGYFMRNARSWLTLVDWDAFAHFLTQTYSKVQGSMLDVLGAQAWNWPSLALKPVSAARER